MNRDFRGIWIPRHIWLDKNLKPIEKILLAEIESLGGLSDGCFASNQYLAEFLDLSTNEKILLAEIESLGGLSDGCFASNQYLAEFFDLSKDRISKLISGLKNKGYITVELIYKEGTCEVEQRLIRIVPSSYFYLGGQNYLGGIGENNDYITKQYNINNNNNNKT